MSPDDVVEQTEVESTETAAPAETDATKGVATAPAAPGKVVAAKPTAAGKPAAGKAGAETAAPAERSLMAGVDDAEEAAEDDAETLTETASQFPDDWRERAAGGDAQKLKALKRFGSHDSWVRSWFTQRDIITKGKQDSPLPEDASDEDKAAWRKGHDVPDDPSGYQIDPPKGVEWDAEDKKHIDAYAKFALDNGMSRAEVKRNAEWFINEQVAELQDRTVEARKAYTLAQREMRKEYGSELEGLLGRAQQFGRHEFGQEEWDKLEYTLMANGNTLGSNPTFLRGLIGMAEKYYESKDPIESGDAGATAVSDSSFKAKHLELVKKRNAGDLDAKKILSDPAYDRRLHAIYEREEGSANRRQASK